MDYGLGRGEQKGAKIAKGRAWGDCVVGDEGELSGGGYAGGIVSGLQPSMVFAMCVSRASPFAGMYRAFSPGEGVGRTAGSIGGKGQRPGRCQPGPRGLGEHVWEEVPKG